jgi:hypothetical protein
MQKKCKKNATTIKQTHFQTWFALILPFHVCIGGQLFSFILLCNHKQKNAKQIWKIVTTKRKFWFCNILWVKLTTVFNSLKNKTTPFSYRCWLLNSPYVLFFIFKKLKLVKGKTGIIKNLHQKEESSPFSYRN